jgi:hypothetical protein
MNGILLLLPREIGGRVRKVRGGNLLWINPQASNALKRFVSLKTDNL